MQVTFISDSIFTGSPSTIFVKTQFFPDPKNQVWCELRSTIRRPCGGSLAKAFQNVLLQKNVDRFMGFDKF